MASYEMMRRYLDQILAGDLEGAAENYTDDVIAHFAGWKDTHGRDAYKAAAGEMMSMIDSLQVEEHDLLVSDDHAVVLNDWHITKGDRNERVNHVIIYHTEGDKTSEIWVVAEDPALMADLMSG